MMPSDKALVFVDNHDNQRGHGAGGASIVTFWDARYTYGANVVREQISQNRLNLLFFLSTDFTKWL